MGDIKESHIHEVDIGDWAHNLLFYKGGNLRKKNHGVFFFTLNYIQRHHNRGQKQWFVRDFVGSAPPTLEELKEDIYPKKVHSFCVGFSCAL